MLAGLIIGFLATNSYNRSAAVTQVPTQQIAAPNAPATGEQNPTAAMPAVAEALGKADNEPTNFDAQIKVADMFARIKNWDKAITYFERANKLKPDDYQIIVTLGNANFDANKFEDAQKWYETALQKKPDDVSVRTDLGLTFFLREPKDIERAIKEYKGSLAINPNHELTLQNLAVAYREKNDAQGLKDTIAQLAKVNPNNQIIQKLKE